MNDKMSSLDEEMERLNFLTWWRISTTAERMDAYRKNREKMRYLMGKYGNEIGELRDLGIEELKKREEELENGE